VNSIISVVCRVLAGAAIVLGTIDTFRGRVPESIAWIALSIAVSNRAEIEAARHKAKHSEQISK
jgi:ABC-type uncharacterized transport system permease subunit